MSGTNELVVIEKLNPATIFTEVAEIDAILKSIEEQAMAHVPVLDTVAGRKDIASMAYRVAQSKTLLDDLGKNLVADWKTKAKKVDEVRKHTRDFLDDLKVRVREPLTQWEAEEAERIAAKELAEKIESDWAEAIKENDLIDRERAIAAKEEAARKAEEEKQAAAAKAKAEQDRKDHEERIAAEAAEKARIEAEQKIKAAEAAARKAEQDKIEAQARAKAEAERAERERIAAEARAKAEQEMAVKAEQARAKAEAKRVELERIEKENAEKARLEKIAANKRHRAKIHREAKTSLEDNGISAVIAEEVIMMIAAGKIKNVTINY